MAPENLPKIRHYILKDGLPKGVDLMTWAQWLETNPDRLVKRTEFPLSNIQVVSVFLKGASIVPLEDGSWMTYLYGTMVRGGPMDGHEKLSMSQEQAEEIHDRIVREVQDILDGKPIQCDYCRKKEKQDGNP